MLTPRYGKIVTQRLKSDDLHVPHWIARDGGAGGSGGALPLLSQNKFSKNKNESIIKKKKKTKSNQKKQKNKTKIIKALKAIYKLHTEINTVSKPISVPGNLREPVSTDYKMVPE